MTFVQFIKQLVYHGLESFGRYYSTYRAFVVSNEDPERLSRLKLIIPEISGDQVVNVWAYPTGVFGGKSYGMQVLPKKGDIVWVEFERGDPNVPLWRHGYFGTNEKPAEEDLVDPNCYWFITPSGIRVVLNDTKNYIKITLPTGESLVVDPHKLSLVHPSRINLGTEDGSAESAVLGDTLTKLLSDILQTLEQMNDFVSQITVTVTGPGFSGPPLNAVAFSMNIKGKLANYRSQLETALSKKVKLD